MSAGSRLLNYLPTLVLARRNLSRASARSALAIAAVVIGVVAVGAIGTGGEAFKRDQLAAYEGFGGTATVSPTFELGDGPDARTLSENELDRIRQAAGSGTVLPVVDLGTRPTFIRAPDGDPILTAQVQGIERIGRFYDMRAGEVPTNWRRSVIVGSRVADTNDIQPGDRISVAVAGEFDRSFRVAAVIEGQGFADPLGADRSVFVPVARFEDPRYGEAIVTVDPQTGSIESVSEDIRAELNARERTVEVDLVRQQRESFESFLGRINQFLIGVGAISLLVAAVTIGNTMLMSAIEREGELGVLRAVGYPKLAVVRLLIAEAGILGLIGAAIGLPITLAIGAVLNQILLGDPFAFTRTGLTYVAVGMVIGVVTALVAGVYPAWRAAQKRPVEAIE